MVVVLALLASLPAHDQARVAPALCQEGGIYARAGLHARIQDLRPGAAGGAGSEWAGPGGRLMARVGSSEIGLCWSSGGSLVIRTRRRHWDGGDPAGSPGDKTPLEAGEGF